MFSHLQFFLRTNHIPFNFFVAIMCVHAVPLLPRSGFDSSRQTNTAIIIAIIFVFAVEFDNADGHS